MRGGHLQEGLNCRAFDWESNGVLDGWSFMGGGRTWRFECS